MSEHDLRDVVVIGAGPAGSGAAARLAALGHDVLLLDRQRFPRDKACGDGLIADALTALRRAGVYERVAAQAVFASAARAFSASGHEVRVRAPFLVLRRERLDQILVDEAVERGAELRTARVTALRPHGGSPVEIILGGGAALRARFVVVACGADVSLLRPLGAVPRPEPGGVAIRCYVRSEAAPLEELVFAFERGVAPGYAWIFPVAPGEYNVGVGVFWQRPRDRTIDVRVALDHFLRDFPPARRLMASAPSVSPVRGARLRMGLAGVRPVTAGCILAVGDSVDATLPLSAEGIGKALETGWLAAEAIDAALRSGDVGAAGSYATAIDRLRPAYRRYRTASRWLAHPWLMDVLVRRAGRSAWVRDRMEGIIRESADPRSVFSIRGVLRSLVPSGSPSADRPPNR